MPAIAAPTHDLPIITNENGVKTIYGFHYDLTQDDLGYKLPEQGRPAAPHHVHVYADTVELNGHLVLPGKDLGIFARKVVVGKSASIDVSGGGAATTFKPGDLPEQKDQNRGAKGSSGASASAGQSSGNVKVVADEVIIASGAAGSPVLRSINFPDAIAAQFHETLQQRPAQGRTAAFSVPVDYQWNFRDQRPCNYMVIKGAIQVPETVLDFAGSKVVSQRDAGDGQTVTVILSGQALKADFAATFAVQQVDGFNGGSTHSIPLSTDDLAFEAEVDLVRDPSRWKLLPGAVRASVRLTLKPGAAIAPDLDRLRSCALKLSGGQAAASAGPGIAAGLKSLAETVCQAFNRGLETAGAPQLVILAQGGTGGRGQDGHNGMQGAPGENGQKTNAYVISDQFGNYTAPPETAGKKGKQGGQAGDAGHSGDGGAGGKIALEVMRWGAVSMLLQPDPGAGGPPASPGARGAGGDGGEGSEFLVHKYDRSNEVETGSGPDGPRGDEGPPASFTGNRGNSGQPGSVEVNGAPFRSAIPLGDYSRIAPAMKVEQLLMVQRIGKLTYLNAAADADYQLAAALFLWLCNVNVESSLATVVPAERTARLAIRSSAQVELMRLNRGLDYFGHPYNWAPVLNLTHNQKRATELIGLGKIVEQQLETYNNANKTTAEKIDALKTTSAKIASELAKTDSAAAVLQKQIDAGERACESLQKDIEAQVVVMKRHQEEIEEHIRKKVNDLCNLENVIKIGSAIISVGKGAFDVVSAIKGGSELAEIVKEAKAAAAAIGQAKEAIEKVQKAVGDLNDLAKQLSIVDDAVKANKPDSVKIAVLKEEFEENLEPLIEKFPEKTKELRGAVRTFFDLNQARNEKIFAYNALFVQKAELRAHAEQLKAEIQALEVVISENKQALVPACYTSFFRSALAWSKQNLIQLLYEESRALYYHAGTPRKELVEKLSDLNFAALADTQARLLTAYDEFLKSVGRPYGPITDVSVTISKEAQPSIFEKLAETGRITFTLDYRLPQFAGLTLVKADSVKVRLPGIKGGPSDVLDVAIVLMGEGAVRPVDNLNDSAVVRFNCPPRPVSFRYSYDPSRQNPILEAGLIADHEFARLSPFTTWTLDFGVSAGLNRFLKLGELSVIELEISGHAFGRRAMKSAPAAG